MALYSKDVVSDVVITVSVTLLVIVLIVVIVPEINETEVAVETIVVGTVVVAGHGGSKSTWYEVYAGLLYASAGAVAPVT